MKTIGKTLAVTLAIVTLTTACNTGETVTVAEEMAAMEPEVVAEPVVPKVDTKEVIKQISGKYWIPVDETKSNLIFTINQNLNLEFINYRGSFEGRYEDTKVFFDDKNNSSLEFRLVDEHLVLKNINDVELEFREATEEEVLAGTWTYSLGGTPLRFVVDANGNWSVPDDPFGTRKGKMSKTGPGTFSVPKYVVGITANLKMKSHKNSSLSWKGALGQEVLALNKTQKGKMESLNAAFN